MTMIRALLVLLLIAATPARAQMAAVYTAGPGGPEVKIEVSASGDIRVSGDGAEGGMIILGGETYLLDQGPEGPEVMRAEDFGAAVSEEFAKLPGPPDGQPSLGARFEKRGEVEINGRKGTAYYLVMPDFGSLDEPDLVISTDPALAPLGAAMAVQLQNSLKILPGDAGALYPFDAMIALLKTGAPLRHSGLELVSVNTAPIPAERFVLPAVPMTRDQVRARIAERFALPGETPGPDAEAMP
jgi:hypothetical protein